MATEQKNTGNSTLKYLKLSEFAKNKTGSQQDYLRNYTKLEGIRTIPLQSLASKEEIILLSEQLQEQKKLKDALKKQKSEQDTKEKDENEAFEFALKSDNIQVIDSFIKKYPDYVNVTNLQEKLSLLKQAEQDNKFTAVNNDAEKAWDNIHNPAYKSKLKGALQQYITKWEDPKNNKGSDFVGELIEKAKQELKTTK